ncbi:hypothetical protein BSR29_06435 [Boudabousia liubingyangii]|uniref:peptide chain release factor N(5)-glutamine methyltransferase n=1 Tax=Boudabousia liubingyangii TaxID=1921764 RepID=A0A1Q5PKU5_9ACTO|nr:HemK/PrmC family methyltransferase [Boudabousia liubingyangii]OKL47252.1 hypothetical protein BSR29_06435 [Boudabousia liubingyangii]
MPKATSVIIKSVRDQLAEAGITSYAREAELIFRHFSGYPHQYAAPSQLDDQAVARILAASQKRSDGVPLQAIFGEMYFRYLTLEYKPGVFIVRPETEMLVDLAKQTIHQKLAQGSGPIRVLELCLGSGAITAALASELAAEEPEAKISYVGVEIDSAAYQVAAINLRRFAPSARILKADALQLAGIVAEHSFDLVVCNPPYIPEQRQLPAEVINYDPARALFGGSDDGLKIPQGILASASYALNDRGVLIMEHDDTQGVALVNSAKEQGYQEAQTIRDLNARDRFLVAKI